MFRSQRAKKFCTLKCYIASGGSQKWNVVQAERSKASMVSRPCNHCGAMLTRKPWRMKSAWVFCDKTCYRAFLADRFDRHIANPESIALPQNYDEFLDRTELPCPVEGCGWVGKALATHANMVHAIPARKFKMMLGFNLKSGLVAKDVALAMSEAAKARGDGERLIPGGHATPAISKYRSLEGREHSVKARALSPRTTGPLSAEARAKISAAAKRRARPMRSVICASCCAEFQTKTFKAISMCPSCVHTRKLEINRLEPWKEVPCSVCGVTFWGTRNLIRISKKGGPPLRCNACRGLAPKEDP